MAVVSRWAILDDEAYQIGTALWDGASPYAPPGGATLAADDGSHPWRPAPAAPVPREATNFQIRAALMARPGSAPGTTLFAELDAVLAAEKGTPEGAVAWQAWEYANVITRGGTLVEAMRVRMGQTQAWVDDLFRDAATIEA